MILAVISENVWLGLINILGLIVLTVIQNRTKNAVVAASQTATEASNEAAEKTEAVKKTAEKAATKVEEVKQELSASTTATNGKLDEIQKVGEENHVLLNSNMGAQLKISSVALHRIADLTKHPDDIAAAELAESLLSEHVRKQAIVDRSQGKVVVTES